MWNVLVVDDNFSNRKLMIEILKEIAQCDVASSSAEALQAYQMSQRDHQPYDLILLDIAMPESSGLDFLSEIRREEESRGDLFGQGVPVIMVTAYKEYAVKAFHAGCDDYILKPVTAETVLEKVARLIRSRKKKVN